ncbi:MAG: PIG-L deacetylase family protein [Candidatus Hermodarchaeota archaeon]
MTKIVFFQPHPDDLELNCGHIIHYLATKSEKKHMIKIASITKGEYGLPGAQYDKFKGEFLAKIRTRELYNAQSLHSIPPENIHFFGYVDGLVEFTKEFINTIAEYLKREKPDVIFAPEAIYTAYYHKDHVNTGKAIYYCIYNKLINFTPILYFYSTLSPNYFFGFNKVDFNLVNQLLACHKTQFWLINYAKWTYKPKTILAGMKLSGWKYAEKYRRVYFQKNNKNRNKPSLAVKILSHWYSGMPFFKAKYPQDVLAELKEKGKI